MTTAELHEILDREAFKRKLIDEKNFFPAIVSRALEETPTADVVPKSEVEELQAKVARLRKENTELLVSKETDIHISMEKLVKVRTEHPIFKAIEEKVAREIFEEIEKIRLNEIKCCEVMREKEYTHAQRNYWEGGEHSLRQLSYWIAELKKKYTESENG